MYSYIGDLKLNHLMCIMVFFLLKNKLVLLPDVYVNYKNITWQITGQQKQKG